MEAYKNNNFDNQSSNAYCLINNVKLCDQSLVGNSNHAIKLVQF